MTTDYKNYSLENFKNWLFDCIGSGEATPEEIYDAIKEVVTEQNKYYKNEAEKTDKLLRLLEGKSTTCTNLGYNAEYHDNMNGVRFYQTSLKFPEMESDTITFTKGN